MSSTVTGNHETTHGPLAHHFENLEQQADASVLGMWVFLASEILFFGGLFTAYTVYRSTHGSAFGDACAGAERPSSARSTRPCCSRAA